LRGEIQGVRDELHQAQVALEGKIQGVREEMWKLRVLEAAQRSLAQDEAPVRCAARRN